MPIEMKRKWVAPYMCNAHKHLGAWDPTALGAQPTVQMTELVIRAGETGTGMGFILCDDCILDLAIASMGPASLHLMTILACYGQGEAMGLLVDQALKLGDVVPPAPVAPVPFIPEAPDRAPDWKTGSIGIAHYILPGGHHLVVYPWGDRMLVSWPLDMMTTTASGLPPAPFKDGPDVVVEI